MSRTPAKITQADVARALRAAKQCEASSIEIRPDGTIHIIVKPEPPEAGAKQLAPKCEIIL